VQHFLKLTDAVRINKVPGKRAVSKNMGLGFNIVREPGMLCALERVQN
jgi:hypothetical protein